MENIIVGIGELLWDIFPERKVLGGAPANFTYHVSQFGFEGYAVSAIGKDLLGQEILDSLKEKRLKHLLEVTDYPTGTVQVTLDSKGIPQYEICEQVAWDNIPFTQRTNELAKRTQTVCFGSLAQRSDVSRDTIRHFLDSVPDQAYKIFDINLRQHFYTRELIHESLDRCNILKINEEEVEVVKKLFGYPELSELDSCRRLLKDYRLKILILTKGTQGSYVLTPEETSFMPTPKVHVADTVGAGDSFTGAFVAALLHGEPIQSSHQLAVEVAAYVCTQHGAMPVLPDFFLEQFRK